MVWLMIRSGYSTILAEGFAVSALDGLIAAQYRLDPGHQLLGIKGLDNVVVGAQLQAQYLVKDLALGGEHDDGRGGFGPDLPADLIAVDARKHQIQQNQIRLEAVKDRQGFLPVIYNHGFITFFCQIQRDKLCDIGVVIYD